MSNTYKRKSIRNINQLNKEQEKVAQEIAALEKNFWGFLNPQSLLISATTMLLSKGTPQKNTSSTKVSKRDDKPNTLLNKRKLHSVKSKLASKAKKAGITFLKWQAIGLVVYFGAKAIKRYKEQRELKQLQKEHKKYSA